MLQRRLYDSGDAKHLLRSYAFKALGVVVDEFYQVTGLPREFRPSSSSNPKKMSPQVKKIFDPRPISQRLRPRSRVEEEGDGGKGKEILRSTHEIVCALKAPCFYTVGKNGKVQEVKENEKDKGKEKEKDIVGCQRKDRCQCLGCASKSFNVYDDEGTVYAMYVESDGGFKVFDVVEELLDDEEAEDGEGELEIPMSPCTSSELDPDTHCFLIRRKESTLTP